LILETVTSNFALNPLKWTIFANVLKTELLANVLFIKRQITQMHIKWKLGGYLDDGLRLRERPKGAHGLNWLLGFRETSVCSNNRGE
jgi:hypothetical protein